MTHEPQAESHEQRIWVLLDGTPGHANQALGVAEKLGGPFEIKNLSYTAAAKLPNIVKGASLLGISNESRKTLAPPWPDLVIGAGRKVAPAARYIKRQSGGKCRIAQLMWPGFPTADFDLIAVPEHDGIAPGGNIMVTLGAPHRLTRELLEREARIWESAVSHLPKPRIALLAGGDTKKGTFTEAHARELGRMASRMAQEAGGALLVTTSRRTRPETTVALRQAIESPMYFHDADLHPTPLLEGEGACLSSLSRRERVGVRETFSTTKSNPYAAFLGLADAIIVTGDSISMCSEACFTGKPVYIYAPEELLPWKHQKFLKTLVAENYASPLQLSVRQGKFPPGGEMGLDVTCMISEKIRNLSKELAIFCSFELK